GRRLRVDAAVRALPRRRPRARGRGRHALRPRAHPGHLVPAPGHHGMGATPPEGTGEPMNLLEVDALTKRFGGLTAVSRFNLTVNAGEIIGLIGPNGAGDRKSTRLN